MNTRFSTALFSNALLRHPERYPAQLESRYPRILDRIAQLWGTNQLEDYLQEVLLDRRDGRQGFAPEVMSDLMYLQGLHFECQAQPEDSTDAWGVEDTPRGLKAQPTPDSRMLLDRAVRAGNEKDVLCLLERGADVRHATTSGWSPLVLACLLGHRNVASVLIAAGADVNAQDERGYAPLHWASLKDYHEVVQLLLKRGAFVNIRSTLGLTPLLQAAARGAVRSMAVLLRFRADVNQADNEGWTPLHKAIANDQVKAAELLLDNGANWEAHHVSGVTPLALARSKPRFIRLLDKVAA